MDEELPELWGRVRQGDLDAWETIVERYAALVYSVARRHGLEASDAEDCCQQTWLALYTSRRRIEDGARLPAWLAGTAYRRAMRILRKRASILRSERRVPEAAPPPTPEEQLVFIQRRRRLEGAIAQLDERCRALLAALFLSNDDSSYRELSHRLNIPFNSLGPTRQRCLAKLKAILEKMK